MMKKSNAAYIDDTGFKIDNDDLALNMELSSDENKKKKDNADQDTFSD